MVCIFKFYYKEIDDKQITKIILLFTDQKISIILKGREKRFGHICPIFEFQPV